MWTFLSLFSFPPIKTVVTATYEVLAVPDAWAEHFLYNISFNNAVLVCSKSFSSSFTSWFWMWQIISLILMFLFIKNPCKGSQKFILEDFFPTKWIFNVTNHSENSESFQNPGSFYIVALLFPKVVLECQVDTGSTPSLLSRLWDAENSRRQVIFSFKEGRLKLHTLFMY